SSSIFHITEIAGEDTDSSGHEDIGGAFHLFLSSILETLRILSSEIWQMQGDRWRISPSLW
ncbi:hypothetical protein LINPERHAP1_LOCUS31668, partial [Linum perenne]